MAKRQMQGSKWIKKDLRLAIYFRDGFACVYCGATVEDGIELSLDHIRGRNELQRMDNHPTNLVTCCMMCNTSRGDRDMRDFIQAVASYRGFSPESVEDHVEGCRSRYIPRERAKALIKVRGSYRKALLGVVERDIDSSRRNGNVD